MRSAKSFEVLPLIFITDCSPIGWLQSVLKIRSFENLFLSFLNFFQATRLHGGVDPLFLPPPHPMYCILVQTWFYVRSWVRPNPKGTPVLSYIVQLRTYNKMWVPTYHRIVQNKQQNMWVEGISYSKTCVFSNNRLVYSPPKNGVFLVP